MADFEPRFLFLSGVGRSGTTALRRSLGLHEQVYYNGLENNAVQDLIEVAMRNCTLPTRKRCMAIGQREYNLLFRNLIHKLIWPEDERSDRPVYMAAINPQANQLDYMRQVFPGCKFVSLVRNGIEVVSSRMKYPSFAAASFSAHCQVWNRSAEVHRWASCNPEDCLILRHEWFYQPQRMNQWMLKLSNMLGIEYSPLPEQAILQSLQHPTSSRMPMGPADFANSTIQDKKRYFQSKRERWRSWTNQQRQRFTDLCAAPMRQLGYELPWQNESAEMTPHRLQQTEIFSDDERNLVFPFVSQAETQSNHLRRSA